MRSERGRVIGARPGAVVINLAVDGDAMAATRFAVSPLMQAGAVLHPLLPETANHVRVGRRQVDDALLDRRLHLLSALRREIHGYAPDFMTPGAAADPIRDLDAELHRVATTPTSVIARQMNRMLQFASPLPGQASSSGAPPGVRDFLELGEQSFAQKAADELASFWQRCLAPFWPSTAADAEADIERRAHVTVRSGLHTALNSLHRDIVYGGGILRLASAQQIEVSGTTDITLFPSALAHSWLVSVDPWQERGIYLIYPTRAFSRRDRPVRATGRPDRPTRRSDPPLGSIIGHSRSLLLTGLDRPRTTTQLADRHHLSASTVSYHLSHLLRAGLVTRVREGSRVYYQRTPEAVRLCERPMCGEGGDDAVRDGARGVRRSRPVRSAPKSVADEAAAGRRGAEHEGAEHEGVVSA